MNCYTYYIKHRPSGKRYYGVRTANRVEPVEDLWKRYFTSSRHVKRLIEEDGIDSFEVQVRRQFTDPKSAHAWEDRFLRRVNALNDDMWINRRVGNKYSEQVLQENSVRRTQLNSDPLFREASSARRRALNMEPTFNAFARANMRSIVSKLKEEGKTSARSANGWSPERRAAKSEANRKMNADPEFKQRQSDRMKGNKLGCKVYL